MAWLAQQYALDMFCRLEEQRLQYVKPNQARFRGGNAGVRIPKPVPGSPAHLAEKTADAMAVLRKKGRPRATIHHNVSGGKNGWCECMISLAETMT